jgi:hypothetical protein
MCGVGNVPSIHRRHHGPLLRRPAAEKCEHPVHSVRSRYKCKTNISWKRESACGRELEESARHNDEPAPFWQGGSNIILSCLHLKSRSLSAARRRQNVSFSSLSLRSPLFHGPIRLGPDTRNRTGPAPNAWVAALSFSG